MPGIDGGAEGGALGPTDEGPHLHSPGVETWTFHADPPPSRPAVDLELGRRPDSGDGWFVARITPPTGPIVMVTDPAVAFPTDGRLELRAPGLWADHVIEEPLERWSLGLEAFGVGVDAVDAAVVDLLDPQLRGERLPVGWDLEWETAGVPVRMLADPGQCHHRIPCRVFGEVVVGHDHHQLDGPGHRSHRWGT